MERDPAVEAAQEKAREWNQHRADEIPMEAAKQIAQAALAASADLPYAPPVRPEPAPVEGQILKLAQEEAREELRRDVSAGMAPVSKQIHAWALLAALDELERQRERNQLDSDLIEIARDVADEWENRTVGMTGDSALMRNLLNKLHRGVEIYARAVTP